MSPQSAPEKPGEKPYCDLIGLTGIIGSGKSTVAEMLRERGFHVIDADLLARRILEPDFPDSSAILRQLADAFPLREGSLLKGGILDRRALAAEAFRDRESLNRLNAIMHPPVERLLREALSVIPEKELPAIYDVPLLYENNLHRRLRAVIVVYCPEEMAIARAAARSGESPEAVKKRLRWQISIEEKRDLADYVIDNTGSTAELESRVDRLCTRIRPPQGNGKHE